MNVEQINEVLATEPVVVLVGINIDEVNKFLNAAYYTKNTMVVTATVAAIGLTCKGISALKKKITKKKEYDNITNSEAWHLYLENYLSNKNKK